MDCFFYLVLVEPFRLGTGARWLGSPR